MPLIYLLRHAQSTANETGVLAGQDYSVLLSKTGEQQSNTLAAELKRLGIDKNTNIISSPLPRCLLTIKPFLRELRSGSERKLENIETTTDFIEMNYGSWQGEKLKTLQKKPEWKKVQSKPETFRFPGGESFTEANKRVQNGLTKLANLKRDSLVVSHGDIIKMAVAFALDLDLNKFQKIHVSPASITVLRFEKQSFEVVSVNRRLETASNPFRKIRAMLGGSNA